MLTVTDSALSHPASALDQIDVPKPDNACFRIIPKADGTLTLTLTLTIDAPSPNDTAYDHNGTTVRRIRRNARALRR